MLAVLLRTPSPKVEVSFSIPFVVIPPSLSVDGDIPLRGVVTIGLPTRQSVQGLSVTLEGKAELYADGKWPVERTAVFRSVVELPLGGAELDAGSLVVPFTMKVLVSATVAEKCKYGQVSYTVVATLELAKNTVSSTPKQVFVAGVPYRGFLPPFEMVHEHISLDLGPIRVQVFSPHLAVSSLVHVRIFLASTPTTINLDSIRLSLAQSFTVHYADTTRPRNPPPTSLPLQYIDTSRNPPTSSEFKSLLGSTVNPGEEGEDTAIFRVGDHDDVRASSAPGTSVKILVSHRISIEVRYQGGAGGNTLKSCAMELPVALGYCEAIPGTWSLPEYTPKPPPKARVRHTTTQGTACFCLLSHAEMVEMYGEALKEAGERVILAAPVVARDEERERLAKTPAAAG